MLSAAPRDASWYARPNVYEFKVVHADNGDEFALCMPVPLWESPRPNGSLACDARDLPRQMRRARLDRMPPPRPRRPRGHREAGRIMTEYLRKTSVYSPEGYLMLGDLRRIVAETQEFDDSARVEAGTGDGDVGAIDTLFVEGSIPTSEESS